MTGAPKTQTMKCHQNKLKEFILHFLPIFLDFSLLAQSQLWKNKISEPKFRFSGTHYILHYIPYLLYFMLLLKFMDKVSSFVTTLVHTRYSQWHIYREKVLLLYLCSSSMGTTGLCVQQCYSTTVEGSIRSCEMKEAFHYRASGRVCVTIELSYKRSPQYAVFADVCTAQYK